MRTWQVFIVPADRDTGMPVEAEIVAWTARNALKRARRWLKKRNLLRDDDRGIFVSAN